jgi:hypothetical protein
MRFLLHPPKTTVNQLLKSKKTVPLRTKPSPSSGESSIGSNTNDIGRTFGQQCSPNCGCAVRFEATYDLKGDNRILSMSYEAKTLLSTISHSHSDEKSNNSKPTLKPVYTSNGKPMLKECKCQTVHSLATTITESMSSMKLSQAQNQLEFLGVRSSPAFRYTVLKNHNLLNKEDEAGAMIMSMKGTQNQQQVKSSVEEKIFNVKEGHCFDLVEDALVACLNGYMPKPRRTNKITSGEYERREKDLPIKSPNRFLERNMHITGDDNDSDEKEYKYSTNLDPHRFVNAAKRRTAGLFYKPKSSMSSNSTGATTSTSSSLPPFHLMNGSTGEDEISNDTLSQLKMEIKSLQQQDNIDDQHDWLSHVDERN